jgi:DNA-binding MarR family transcriptional regulator
MRPKSRLANDAWEALLTAHARRMKGFFAEDIWDEVSMREYDVLYTLSKRDRPLRVGELHDHVLLSQPALSRLVDRLVARGLVERRKDPEDRRGVLVGLTEEGRASQRRVGRRHARSVARAVSGALTIEEMEQLELLASKLAGEAGK